MATIVDGYTLTPCGYVKNADRSGPYVIPASGSPYLVGQGVVAAGATDAGNPIKVGGVYNASHPTYTTGQRGDLQIGTRGSLNVTLFGENIETAVGVSSSAGAAAGSNTQGVLLVRAYLELFNGVSWDQVTKSNSTSRLLSAAASTNATSVKASAGNVYRIRGENTNAAKRYLKLYNKASAPTVGTDTPVLTFVLAATAPFDIDLGALGHYCSTGIAYAITTAAADSDTGALTAGDVACMNITYA